MTNTTQCPECSSIFVISDEQYSASKGNVRCGSCREKFRVVFLPNTNNLVVSRNAGNIANKGSISVSQKKSPLLKILSRHADDDHPQAYEQETLDKIFSETSLDVYSVTSIDPGSSNSYAELATYSEIEISLSSDTFTLIDEDHLNNELIDEVDTLIENKILAGDTTIADTQEDSSEPFRLKPKWTTRVFRGFKLFFLLVLGALLITVLIYQLWLRQLLPDTLNEPISRIQNSFLPFQEKLADEYGYSLPVRRDVNRLELISAATEAHPTRASTLLLRVSLLSRSNIEQPLPDLELSLTDENGRLVSRRTFTPNDYLYNNATENLIGPDELKKVTIELLAFPQQAHGYELRMVY